MICISMSMLFKGQTERAEELDVTGEFGQHPALR
jgi:hypothetical protein